jgi:DNA-binding NarL/FixJ family response regulator
VAVFAVPDRFDGLESVFLSLLTLAIGIIPVVVVAYLFRGRIPVPTAAPPAPSHNASPARSSDEHAGTLLEPLSERELEVLALVARGRSNKEIATELVVGIATVKTHLNNINRKLDTSSRTEAIAIARDRGLL